MLRSGLRFSMTELRERERGEGPTLLRSERNRKQLWWGKRSGEERDSKVRFGMVQPKD